MRAEHESHGGGERRRERRALQRQVRDDEHVGIRDRRLDRAAVRDRQRSLPRPAGDAGPHRAVADRETLRCPGEPARGGDRVGSRVDPAHRAVRDVRRPHDAVAERDLGHAEAQRDRPLHRLGARGRSARSPRRRDRSPRSTPRPPRCRPGSTCRRGWSVRPCSSADRRVRRRARRGSRSRTRRPRPRLRSPWPVRRSTARPTSRSRARSSRSSRPGRRPTRLADPRRSRSRRTSVRARRTLDGPERRTVFVTAVDAGSTRDTATVCRAALDQPFPGRGAADPERAVPGSQIGRLAARGERLQDRRVAGSMCVIVRSSAFSTQTPLSPNTMLPGVVPTPVYERCRPVAASIAATALPPRACDVPPVRASTAARRTAQDAAAGHEQPDRGGVSHAAAPAGRGERGGMSVRFGVGDPRAGGGSVPAPRAAAPPRGRQALRAGRGRSTRSQATGRRRAPPPAAAGTARRPGAPPPDCRRRRARPSDAGIRSPETAPGRSSARPTSRPPRASPERRHASASVVSARPRTSASSRRFSSTHVPSSPGRKAAGAVTRPARPRSSPSRGRPRRAPPRPPAPRSPRR